MQFNSPTYLVFLPVVAAVYFAAPGRARLWVLLAASYAFYAAWNPFYLPLVLGLTAVNYAVALGVARVGAGSRRGRWLVRAGVGLDLAALGYYKYALFMLDSLARAAAPFGLYVSPARPTIVLPLGISFFV